ncbi:hypothetical protein Q1695_009045 [Nippostrongylus brasiliensis]|nr:hypothetical protein Q1695_009045 [Nippostrongylus brasiliensis]
MRLCIEICEALVSWCQHLISLHIKATATSIPLKRSLEAVCTTVPKLVVAFCNSGAHGSLITAVLSAVEQLPEIELNLRKQVVKNLEDCCALGNFQRKFAQIIAFLEDHKQSEMVDYLMTNYLVRVTTWASFTVQGAEMDTTMLSERWHLRLKIGCEGLSWLSTSKSRIAEGWPRHLSESNRRQLGVEESQEVLNVSDVEAHIPAADVEPIVPAQEHLESRKMA